VQDTARPPRFRESQVLEPLLLRIWPQLRQTAHGLRLDLNTALVRIAHARQCQASQQVIAVAVEVVIEFGQHAAQVAKVQVFVLIAAQAQHLRHAYRSAREDDRHHPLGSK